MKSSLVLVNILLIFSLGLLCSLSFAQDIKILKECASENLKILNDYRLSNGLGSLTMNSEARKRAEMHTEKMTSMDSLYHSDSSVYMDYENVAQNWMAEDEDEKDVAVKIFDQWKESPGHNRNMLAGDTKYAGIACVADTSDRQHKVYATQIFWKVKHAGNNEIISPQATVTPTPMSNNEPKFDVSPQATQTPTPMLDDGPKSEQRPPDYDYGSASEQPSPEEVPSSNEYSGYDRFPKPSKEPKTNTDGGWYWYSWWTHGNGPKNGNDVDDSQSKGGNKYWFY